MAAKHPSLKVAFGDAELERALELHAQAPTRRRERMIAAIASLWHNRTLLYRCAAVGLVVSTLVAFLIPPRYTSTARLMPPEQGAGAGMAAMLASVVGKDGSDMGSMATDFLGLKTSGDLFLGVLKSRTVEDAVIAKLDLRKVYWDRRWQDARKDLEERTDLSADRKSGIITIMVEDRNPQRAAAVAQEYVSQLTQIVTLLGNSSAHKERLFLEDRLSQVNQDLEQSEQQFSKFASSNTAIDIKEQGKSMLDAVGKTEGELIAAQTELQGLRQLYTDDNVRIRTSQARIDELRRELQKLGGRANPAAGSDSSPNQVDDYPSIRQLPGLGVPYADLYRRVKVEEAIFETLTKQYELAKIQEAKEAMNVKVLDEPEIPEKKSFPPRLIFMVVGTLMAVAMGSCWIWGSARWKKLDSRDPGKIVAMDMYESARKVVVKVRTRVGDGGREKR